MYVGAAYLRGAHSLFFKRIEHLVEFQFQCGIKTPVTDVLLQGEAVRLDVSAGGRKKE